MAETAAVIPGHDNSNILYFDTMTEGADHPECEADEIFLKHGNAWTYGVFYAGYETRRRGTKVIDDFGRDRTADAKHMGILPIFAKREEHDRLRQEALARCCAG